MKLDEAKVLIDEYCMAEFGYGTDYHDLHNVELAFTTITDDEIEIQVNVDLIECAIKRYLDNVLFEIRKYVDLDELIQKELQWLDFNELVYVDEDDVERFMSIVN